MGDEIALGVDRDVVYSVGEACQLVLEYCTGRDDPVTVRPPSRLRHLDIPKPKRPASYGYLVYDAIPRSVGARDAGVAELADLLVSNALNARMGGREYVHLHAAMPAVNGELSTLRPSLKLLDVSRDGLRDPGHADPETQAMWRSWWAVAQIPGLKDARVNKFLHRVRPELFPLVDNLTMPYLGGNYWVAVYRDLEDNLGALLNLQEDVSQGLRAASDVSTVEYGEPIPTPSLLRLHDILLWTRAQRELRSTAVR